MLRPGERGEPETAAGYQVGFASRVQHGFEGRESRQGRNARGRVVRRTVHPGRHRLARIIREHSSRTMRAK
jgi:hypothetical protein